MHEQREADISILRASDRRTDVKRLKETEKIAYADTERESEKRKKRSAVTDLDVHVQSTALTVAQASSIRQADSSETSSTPSRTLLSSFNHACTDSLLFAFFIKYILRNKKR